MKAISSTLLALLILTTGCGNTQEEKHNKPHDIDHLSYLLGGTAAICMLQSKNAISYEYAKDSLSSFWLAEAKHVQNLSTLSEMWQKEVKLLADCPLPK